ncbi:MAG: nitroreductase [Chlorobiaceae bacterium]|jgi:nitroreductase|nr:nitroreductase [Chlorobiaceae bacterium]NTW63535.1 nitroreductase [Chlorobiaceae bacterium]
MDFHDLVRERCSIRGFERDRKIPREILEKILEAGRLAPSAKNLQPWKFKVVSSPELLSELCASYSRDWLRSAPHLLVVTGRRQQAWVRSFDGYNSLETDLTIAMDHMILAAASEGVATCWIAAFNPVVLRSALGLPEHEEVFAMTPLGYASADAVIQQKNRKPLAEIVEFL